MFANAVVVFPVVQPLVHSLPHGLSVERAIINRSAHDPCMSLPIRQFLPDGGEFGLSLSAQRRTPRRPFAATSRGVADGIRTRDRRDHNAELTS